MMLNEHEFIVDGRRITTRTIPCNISKPSPVETPELDDYSATIDYMDGRWKLSFLDDNVPLEKIAYTKQTITLYARLPEGLVITKLYCTTKEGGFTVKRLFECIEDFENITRPYTRWLGGVDHHHRYFEGLCSVKDPDDNRHLGFDIGWGS